MKSSTRILLIVGVIVLIAIGVWNWKGKSAPDELVTQSSSPTVVVPLASASPLVVAYDAPGTDWKTYASTSAGFKVSYPSDWLFGSCAPGCTGWSPPTAASGQYALGIIQGDSTVDELLANAQPYLVAKEDVKVGDNTWLKLTLRQPATGEVITSHFIAHGGNLWEFGTATSAADILKVYGSMIRSFVFTK